MDIELLEMHTRAVTAGTDALAEVIVRILHDDVEATGQAASVDTLEATLKAFISAVSSACVKKSAA
jgi:2-isopropylmalate synthase